MSGPENKPDDSALEEFLAGRSEVSQAYRAVAKEVPPAELDTAVVDFARREASRAPAPGRFRRADLLERWRWPVTAAAMLVLSFNVLLAIRNDRDARQATMLESSAPSAVPSSPPAEAPALAAENAIAEAREEMQAESGVAAPGSAAALQEAPPAPPPPRAEPGQAAKLAPAKPATQQPVPAEPRAEPDAAMIDAPSPMSSPAEPFPAAPPAAAASAEEGRRKRMAGQAEMQQREAEALRGAESQAQAARRSSDAMAKQERQDFAAQGAGAAAPPGDAIQAFLQRPSVQRMPLGGVILDQPERLLRQGRRKADGTCGFPQPPAGEGGAAVVELQLAVDIETCEVLVERGYLRK